MKCNRKYRGPVARLLRDCRGAVAVEFTLVAPVLFSLALGCIEFGRYLQQHHIVIQSARDATRFLSRTEMICAGTTDFCCPSTDASWGTAETAAKNLAMRGSTDPAAPLLVSSWSDPSTISFSVTCLDNTAGGYLGEADIPIIETSIVTPYAQFGFLSFLGVGALNISIEHEEVNFGE